ncbi:hypothetical protein BDZ89DRAFT_272968 [Hymenopellis radicata]|nr:hypothetical protein BDZ89DRAFT_272968 [Hymenopellis radicata]
MYQFVEIRLTDASNPPHSSNKPLSDVRSVNCFQRRIHGWSWQAFPIGMGTGAVYVTLGALQYHPAPLTTVEICLYFLNMALFLFNTTMLSLQAFMYPRQAWRLIQDPVKGIFVPLFVLSFATIIIGTINYAVPSGNVGVEFIYTLFWVYVTLSVAVCFPMLMIWFNKPHDIGQFTPAYAFLIFPMMLVGVIAFKVLEVLDPQDQRALGVLFVGYFFQGIGFFMTFFYLCIYMIRVMMTGFLDGHQANGAFVACGPPGFTALALIKLGKAAEAIFSARDDGGLFEDVGRIWFQASVLAALMLYGLAVFFFIFAVLPYWFKVHKHLNEILGCWALTFPNVGWINTTRLLSDLFQIRFLNVVHTTMVVFICITWIVLFSLTVLAFCRGLIFNATPEDVLQEASTQKRLPLEDIEKQQLPSRFSSSVTLVN